ncbi:MAG: cytochrome c-type biosis protein, partial [Gaiellaceae bacterium]|nr:cytochrome c-type biosis protein [Gaiellaceae bacterium]
MAERVPIAFLAGLLSFLAPCVLPLVPGYLSAVSAVGAGDLGRPGVSRRVVLASLPFVAGFTLVFVALGALSGLVGGALGGDQRLVYSVAGFL